MRLPRLVQHFVCRQLSGARRLVTEHLPALVAPSARTTQRLLTVRPALGSARGGPAGALCLVDSKPHEFSTEQLSRLKKFAALVEAEIQR